MRRERADGMLLATVVLWAFNFTVSKYVLSHGLEPLSYASVRYVLATLLFLAITLALERSLRVGRRDLAALAGCGAVLLLNQVGFVYALHYTAASTVALVFGSLPVFTGLFAAAVGVERLTRRFVLAASISFAGVALVALGSPGGLSADFRGELLALVSTIMWAVYSVAIAPLMTRHSPYRISVVVLAVTAALLLVLGAGQLRSQAWPHDRLVWAGFAFAVVGPLVVTNVLWFTAIHRVGPGRASMFANLQPFLAAVFALVLLSESLSWLQVAGGVAIGAGIAISHRRPVRLPVPAE